MRRKDREIKDLDTIKEIVSKCEVVRLAMCDNNIPYMVPLNYGYEFDNDNLILYCHCANSGKKLDILSKNPNVFIEIDNEHNIIEGKTPCDYGFEYFCVMSSGKVEFVYDIYDKIHGLNKIMEHYTSNVKNEFKNEILNKVFLFKITCDDLSAKSCKR